MRVYLSSTSQLSARMPFGVELRVQLDEAVPDRVDRALAIQKIAVERRQVAKIALAQDAARARLLGGRRRCLLPSRAGLAAPSWLRSTAWKLQRLVQSVARLAESYYLGRSGASGHKARKPRPDKHA